MTYLPKAFFGFLVTIMLLSVVLSYEGIAKQKRENQWQWNYTANEYQHHDPGFLALTNKTITYLDSIAGKIISWTSIFVISIACGIVAFRYDRLYCGLMALLLCTTFYSWIGVKIWIFDRFMIHVSM